MARLREFVRLVLAIFAVSLYPAEGSLSEVGVLEYEVGYELTPSSQKIYRVIDCPKNSEVLGNAERLVNVETEIFLRGQWENFRRYARDDGVVGRESGECETEWSVSIAATSRVSRSSEIRRADGSDLDPRYGDAWEDSLRECGIFCGANFLNSVSSKEGGDVSFFRKKMKLQFPLGEEGEKVFARALAQKVSDAFARAMGGVRDRESDTGTLGAEIEYAVNTWLLTQQRRENVLHVVTYRFNIHISASFDQFWGFPIEIPAQTFLLRVEEVSRDVAGEPSRIRVRLFRIPRGELLGIWLQRCEKLSEKLRMAALWTAYLTESFAKRGSSSGFGRGALERSLFRYSAENESEELARLELIQIISIDAIIMLIERGIIGGDPQKIAERVKALGDIGREIAVGVDGGVLGKATTWINESVWLEP